MNGSRNHCFFVFFYCQMFVAEPFPGPVKLKEVAALTTNLIRFDYLVKIYIQELCEHPLWGVSKKGKDCKEGKLRSNTGFFDI